MYLRFFSYTFFCLLFLFIQGCDYEKDISDHQNVSFILDKNFTLRESVFIVENSYFKFSLLEVPNTYGLPSLNEYIHKDKKPQKSHMKILGVLPKSSTLSLKKITRRRPLFKEEQTLVWIETDEGREVVINPVFDLIGLPEKPHKRIFEEPHFLNFLDN